MALLYFIQNGFFFVFTLRVYVILSLYPEGLKDWRVKLRRYRWTLKYIFANVPVQNIFLLSRISFKYTQTRELSSIKGIQPQNENINEKSRGISQNKQTKGTTEPGFLYIRLL